MLNFDFSCYSFLEHNYFFKNTILVLQLNHERKYNPPVHVLAGGAAGACASAITTPLDVVKTLLNTQETGFTKGMAEAVKQVSLLCCLKFLLAYQHFQ